MNSPSCPGAGGRLRLISLVTLAAVLAVACGRRGKDAAATGIAAKGDALFVAEAPALVPEESQADLAAMGISRLYVTAARLQAGGKLETFPPPPNPIQLPVLFTVTADEGVAASLLSGAKGDLVGEALATSLTKPLAEARAWSKVAGIHLHLLPLPQHGETLAAALKALRRATGLPVSVTVRSGFAGADWKPLAGAADELVVLALGRRPETGDLMVPEMTEASAREMPVPFRLLLVPGGYGRGGGGTAPGGRRIPDGEIDRLSEDRGLDFTFDQVLSNEPGNLYSFKTRSGVRPGSTLLAADGGAARFQVLPVADLLRTMTSAASWGSAQLRGRVFLVDAVPRDGRLVGFAAVRALLTGKPYQPRLKVEAVPRRAGRGDVEFLLRVENDAPTPTDLSHYDNWVQIRAEGGAVTGVQAGDFDRFELYAADEPKPRSTTFGRATVVRLFENLFAPGEANEAGPIRISGARPRLFTRVHLVQPDGQSTDLPEEELTLVLPTPEPPPTPAPRKRR